MTYTLPNYVVQEVFDITIKSTYEVTTITASALRYALRNKIVIWVL